MRPLRPSVLRRTLPGIRGRQHQNSFSDRLKYQLWVCPACQWRRVGHASTSRNSGDVGRPTKRETTAAGRTAAGFEDGADVDADGESVAGKDFHEHQLEMLPLPKHGPTRSTVAAFNSKLEKLFEAPYLPRRRQALWQEYQELRRSEPQLLQEFPLSIWWRLWQTQAVRNLSDWERMADRQRLNNLQSLAEDMRSVRKRFNVEKSILEVERLYAFGDEEGALRRWEEVQANTATSRMFQKWTSRKKWLELGVRLYFCEGNLDRMGQILSTLIYRCRTFDPQLVTAAIEHYNSLRDHVNRRRAWGLYLQFRALAFDQDPGAYLSEYKQIFYSFLRADQKSCAMAVLEGIAKLQRKNSQDVRAVVAQGFSALIDACNGIEQINHYYLMALASFPVEVQDMRFFTQWLRVACIHGPAEDVARVIELMFERGKEPETWHFNVLLKSWFNSTWEDKAEDFALDMIKRTAEKSERGPKVPTYVRRPISSASADTFLRLARHYAEKGHLEHAATTIQLLKQSDPRLRQRANHDLLRIYLEMNAYKDLWAFFEQLPESQINLHTFAIVWKGLLNLRKAYHDASEPHPLEEQLKAYPDARDLFNRMTSFILSHPGDYSRGMEPKHMRILCNRVIRAFCLSRDTLGAILAVDQLSQQLDVEPGLKTMDILLTHVAHDLRHMEVDWDPESTLPERMDECKLRAEVMLEEALAQTERALEASRRAVADTHAADLQEDDVSPRDGVGLRRVLGNLLRNVVERKWDLAGLQARFAKARREMGLPEKGAPAFAQLLRNGGDGRMLYDM